MRYKKFLRIAREMSLGRFIPNKQHIVVCVGFIGKDDVDWHLNTEDSHAEAITLSNGRGPILDRLVVYRFNRADPERLDRPSCPCFRCVPLVRRSNVRKVEFMTGLGPVVVKVNNLIPYNGKDLNRK